MLETQEKATILVVDDRPGNVLAIRTILKEKYQLLEASNGLDALLMAHAEKVDLILLDVSMPHMDGYEVCTQLKADPSTREIPIIFLTARDGDQDEAKGLQLGAIDYIVKPFNSVVIRARIDNQLELKRNRDAMERMTTALRVATQAAEAARQEAEMASQAKSEFLANMSHEIRTPMNAAIGLTELALECDLSPQVRDYLTKISYSSHSLLRIINDVLDFSKIEAGKLELEPVDFFLRDVFDHLSNLFQNGTASKNLELIMRMAEERRFALHGDYARLEQILTNLISNAIKFTKQGEIEARVRMLEQQATDATSARVVLEFSVRDTGIGLNPEQTKPLFDPFVQADTSTTRLYGGTGLGLTICKRLVDLMDGHIWVESTPGEGTTFRFTVAFRRRLDAEEGHMIPPDDLQHLHALVVDDNPTTRQALQEILQVFTFTTTTTASGQDAVETIRNDITSGKACQLILVDWAMPTLNGIETVEKIVETLTLASSQASWPKIILLVPFDWDASLEARAKGVGVGACLTKPVHCSLLFDTIMNLFGRHIIKQYQPERERIDLAVVIKHIGGARVLLVEDNAINQQVAQETLQNVGLHVDVAEDGREATQKVKNNPYDLVLMDIQMPEMDGYLATRIIRSNPRFETLPIIAMTAHAMTGDREKCLAAGMNDHVSKPINRSHLYAVLMRWIPSEGRSGRIMPPIPPKKPTEGHPANMPETLPGIDIPDALERLGDNHPLFHLLLLEFHRDFSNAGKELQTLLSGRRQEDFKTAGRLVHTIRGMAGNLSARPLFVAAEALERGIQLNKQTTWPTLLEAFQKRLKQLLDSIGTATPKETIASVNKTLSIHPAQVQSLLSKLTEQLESSNLAALKSFESLKNMLAGQDLPKEMETLETALYQLRFSDAQAALAACSETLLTSLEHGTSQHDG